MIYAVCNQKGGVGKTTVAVNLAWAFAKEGMRVLAIDADPQGNMTEILGCVVDENTLTLNDVLAGIANGGELPLDPIAPAIAESGKVWPPSLLVVPSERQLATREQDIALGRESRLKAALGSAPAVFDAVIIDCPPSMGMLTTNALTAADKVLVVTEPRTASVDGMAEMVDTIGLIRTHYNPRLRLHKVIVNRYEKTRLDQRKWLPIIHEDYEDLVAETKIPMREAIPQAASVQSPLATPETKEIFEALAAEVFGNV